MKITLITTIFNEEATIESFLKSVLSQSRLPDELVIVDGGSMDKTMDIIKSFLSKHPTNSFTLHCFEKKGNRAVGRNEAVKKATGDIMACSDAGCILDSNWIENITKPFTDKTIDVVAGYYDAKTTTVFQKCLVPYVLVMPDRVDPTTFLPATRSMAFRKVLFEKIGGFEEQYSHNEDFVFAQKLKSKKINIYFAKDAIVYWIPRNTIKEAFVMFYRFALGDGEARIFRPKVLLIYIRYVLGLAIVSFLLSLHVSALFFVIVVFFAYSLWAVQKNYKYVHDWHAWYLLPLLQYVADVAVMIGTLRGVFLRYG